MQDFTELLRQGNAWLFMPSAILLGALHGLEPGHSKTLMAAFIVAVRGSMLQAVLLGLAATLSHTVLVWVVALAGLYAGTRTDPAGMEAYFQVLSAGLMLGVGAWMIWRTRRQLRQAAAYEGHDHHAADGHACGHHHAHHEVPDAARGRVLDTGHGRFVLRFDGAAGAARCLVEALTPGLLHGVAAGDLRLTTERRDGDRTEFEFERRGAGFITTQSVPEPHEFILRLHFTHGDHGHDYDLEFVGADARHVLPDYNGLDLAAPGYQDPHELAHANDIRRRFANREVSTGQIVLFGLTAGLIPCPAAISVLLLCLQVREIALGAGIVLCFSIGLALTLVASGTLAAWSVRHAERRWSGIGAIARRAPYLSGAVILVLGLWVGLSGLGALR